MSFEGSRVIFWSLCSEKEPTRLQVERKLSFSFWCQIAALEARACAKGKFLRCWLEKFHCCLDFYFFRLFLSSALLLLFFPHFFSCRTFTRLHFRGKVFARSQRTVKLFWRKYELLVWQDFQWNFLVKITWLFGISSGLFHWMGLCWVRFERSRPPTQVGCQSCLVLLKMVQRKWFHISAYVRFQESMG